MADMIKGIVTELNSSLNLPPFSGQQLLPEEIQTEREIAFLRIHVERAIGRIKALEF